MAQVLSPTTPGFSALTPPGGPASVKHFFSPSDWFFIGSALSSSSAMGVIFLTLVGRVSFTKPFSICVVTTIVLGVLAEMFKDQKFDMTPVVDIAHSFIPKPTFDTAPYPGEEVVHASEHGVVPLINRGSDCFMNATLQVIVHDPLLRDALHRRYQADPTPEAVAFCRVLQFYSEGKTVSSFNLRQFMPDPVRFGQQDAYEFLQQLLNDLTAKDYPELFPSQTTTYFWQQRDASDQIIQEKQTTVQAREFNSIIQIPSQAGMVSGQGLIDQHFAKKPHEGEMWMDGADAYSPGDQQVQFDQVPKRLVFVLKRFNRDDKISTPVDMPEELVVNRTKYSLKKIIVHHGATMRFGHYTALLQRGGKWIYASDMQIRESADSTSDRQNGYIYFYELKEVVE